MGKFKLPESGQKMWNDAVKIVMLVLVRELFAEADAE